VELLRARALIRLSRLPEARRAATDALAVATSPDAAITARMLLGNVDVRLGNYDLGLARLEAVAEEARDAHPSIRSEIQLHRGYAYWTRRETDAAESALAAVEPTSDVIYATALNLYGWIATWKSDYVLAIDRFTSALTHLDTCKAKDRFVEANTLEALSWFAAERIDRDLQALIDERAAAMDWCASDLSTARFWLPMNRALICEVEGDAYGAIRETRRADDNAPSDAYRVRARCRRASMARDAGEMVTAREHTLSAKELFDKIEDPSALKGDERAAPLVLADALAWIGEAADAQAMLALYHAYPETSTAFAMTGDKRKVAWEQLIQGKVYEVSGEISLAHHAYRNAHQTLQRIGYKRCAMTAALRLAAIASDQGYLLEYIDAQTKDLSPKYWIRRELGHLQRLRDDDAARRLTHTEQQVLRLICAGNSNEDIVRLRKRALSTVKNMVSSIFEKFGVSNRTELLIECERREIFQAPR
jgi:DNA-binding CsgD family transcriptional regulator